MIQVLPKWRVRVMLRNGADERVFWISDTSLANVMRKVSEIQFSEKGLDEPVSVCVTLVQ